MNKAELKEIVTAVIRKLETSSPSTACGLFWADNVAQPLYGVPAPEYMVQEPEPVPKYAAPEVE